MISAARIFLNTTLVFPIPYELKSVQEIQHIAHIVTIELYQQQQNP